MASSLASIVHFCIPKSLLEKYHSFDFDSIDAFAIYKGILSSSSKLSGRSNINIICRDTPENKKSVIPDEVLKYLVNELCLILKCSTLDDRVPFQDIKEAFETFIKIKDPNPTPISTSNAKQIPAPNNSLEIPATISNQSSNTINIASSPMATSRDNSKINFNIYSTLKLVLSEILPDISADLVNLEPFESDSSTAPTSGRKEYVRVLSNSNSNIDNQGENRKSSDPLSLAQSFWIRTFSIFLSVCDSRCPIENSLAQLHSLAAFVGKGDRHFLTMSPALGVALDVVVQRSVYELSDKIANPDFTFDSCILNNDGSLTQSNPNSQPNSSRTNSARGGNPNPLDSARGPLGWLSPRTIARQFDMHASHINKCISIMNYSTVDSCVKIENSFFEVFFPPKYWSNLIAASQANKAAANDAASVKTETENEFDGNSVASMESSSNKSIHSIPSVGSNNSDEKDAFVESPRLVDDRRVSKMTVQSSMNSRTQKLAKQLKEALAWSSCSEQLPVISSEYLVSSGFAADSLSGPATQISVSSNKPIVVSDVKSTSVPSSSIATASSSITSNETGTSSHIDFCDAALRSVCNMLNAPAAGNSAALFRNQLQEIFNSPANIKALDTNVKISSEGSPSVTIPRDRFKSTDRFQVDVLSAAGSELLGAATSILSTKKPTPDVSNSSIGFYHSGYIPFEADFNATIISTEAPSSDTLYLQDVQTALSQATERLNLDIAIENSLKHLRSCLKEMKTQVSLFVKDTQIFMNSHFRKYNKANHSVLIKPVEITANINQATNEIKNALQYLCDIGERLVEVMFGQLKQLRCDAGGTHSTPNIIANLMHEAASITTSTSPTSTAECMANLAKINALTSKLNEISSSEFRANFEYLNLGSDFLFEDYVTLKTLKFHVDNKHWLIIELNKLNEIESTIKKRYLKTLEGILVNDVDGSNQLFRSAKYTLHATKPSGIRFLDGRENSRDSPSGLSSQSHASKTAIAKSLPSFISSSNSPGATITDLPKQWSCLLSINDYAAVANSKLLNMYLRFDTSNKIKDYITAIVYFARCHHICDAEKGTLGFFGWVIVALHVLLKYDIVPNLHEDSSEIKEIYKYANTQSNFRRFDTLHESEKIPTPDYSSYIEKLKSTNVLILLNLFYRYITEEFDILGSIITLSTNNLVKTKANFPGHYTIVAWRLCIEDPHAVTMENSNISVPIPYDLGSKLTRPGQIQVLKAVRRASFGINSIITKSTPSNLDNLITMLFSKDGLLDLARMSGYTGASDIYLPLYNPILPKSLSSNDHISSSTPSSSISHNIANSHTGSPATPSHAIKRNSFINNNHNSGGDPSGFQSANSNLGGNPLRKHPNVPPISLSMLHSDKLNQSSQLNLLDPSSSIPPLKPNGHRDSFNSVNSSRSSFTNPNPNSARSFGGDSNPSSSRRSSDTDMRSPGVGDVVDRRISGGDYSSSLNGVNNIGVPLNSTGIPASPQQQHTTKLNSNAPEFISSTATSSFFDSSASSRTVRGGLNLLDMNSFSDYFGMNNLAGPPKSDGLDLLGSLNSNLNIDNLPKLYNPNDEYNSNSNLFSNGSDGKNAMSNRDNRTKDSFNTSFGLYDSLGLSQPSFPSAGPPGFPDMFSFNNGFHSSSRSADSYTSRSAGSDFADDGSAASLIDLGHGNLASFSGNNRSDSGLGFSDRSLDSNRTSVSSYFSGLSRDGNSLNSSPRLDNWAVVSDLGSGSYPNQSADSNLSSNKAIFVSLGKPPTVLPPPPGTFASRVAQGSHNNNYYYNSGSNSNSNSNSNISNQHSHNNNIGYANSLYGTNGVGIGINPYLLGGNNQDYNNGSFSNLNGNSDPNNNATGLMIDAPYFNLNDLSKFDS